MESERELLYWYRKFNALWFGGELPEDVSIFWEAVTKTYADCVRIDSGEWVIRINPSLRGWKAQKLWAILHEMAHIRCYPYLKHGKKFQDEMIRLANLGAFKEIW